MQEFYIGMMSGTSVNSIDAALVDLSNTVPKLLTTHEHPIPEDIRLATLKYMQPQPDEIHGLFELDHRFGQLLADAAVTLIKKSGILATEVRAIGSHGQTIRHQPNHVYPYTIQIGDPNIIAARTGITTVADFRRRDVANGGQGAPFAPIFHAQVLGDKHENRAIINIGGIANVTLLSQGAEQAQLGFDTGPGNGLIDSWIQLHLQQSYDRSGAWAAEGIIIPELLEVLLAESYFQQPAPKSTGRDHFNLAWLQQILSNVNSHHKPVDIQTTLTELTAASIVKAIVHLPIAIDRIILCGGGVHNTYLVKRIQALAAPIAVNISDEYGIAADWVEAELFAWLAQQTLQQIPVDLTRITGTHKANILGGIYWA